MLFYAFNYAWRPYFLRENNIHSFQKISSYVFFGLAAGMAAGTSSYFLAIIGVVIISILSIILYKTNNFDKKIL